MSMAKRLAIAHKNLREAELAMLEIEAHASVDSQAAPGKDNADGASGADATTLGRAPAPIVQVRTVGLRFSTLR